MTYSTVCLIALGLVLAGFGLALFAGRIPWLRALTGADPLEAEEPSLADDLVRGFAETDEQWMARTGTQPTNQQSRKELGHGA